MSKKKPLKNAGGRDSEDEAEPREAHPWNPLMTRGASGIWGDDVLHITDWEAGEHRVVLPMDIANDIGIESRILRWADQKFKLVLEKHVRDRSAITALDDYVTNWQFYGIEETSGFFRILFQDEHGRWYSFTFGQDRHGSWNAISITGGSSKHFLENRLRGMKSIQGRKE